MIDHTGLTVSDFGKTKTFYARALAPIGYEAIMELSAAATGHGGVAGFGLPPKPDFWIAAASQTFRLSTLRSVLQAAPSSTRSMELLLLPVAVTTALQAFVLATTLTITGRSSWIRTGTTSRPFAMIPRERSKRALNPHSQWSGVALGAG